MCPGSRVTTYSVWLPPSWPRPSLSLSSRQPLCFTVPAPRHGSRPTRAGGGTGGRRGTVPGPSRRPAALLLVSFPGASRTSGASCLPICAIKSLVQVLLICRDCTFGVHPWKPVSPGKTNAIFLGTARSPSARVLTPGVPPVSHQPRGTVQVPTVPPSDCRASGASLLRWARSNPSKGLACLPPSSLHEASGAALQTGICISVHLTRLVFLWH